MLGKGDADPRKAKFVAFVVPAQSLAVFLGVVPLRRVLSHAPRETTRSFARRLQRNTRIPACSRGIARWHRRCPFLTRDGPDLTNRIARRDVRGDGMEDSQGLRGTLCQVFWWSVRCRWARRVLPREVDPPTLPAAPDPGDGRGSLFAPSAWLVLSTPVQKQIDLKLYGFYIGDLQVPVAQVDLPIRMAKFLTVTPSYMGYSVPASGLNEMTPQPGSICRQLQGAPISSRRDRGVRRSQVRDLRSQHVCPTVSSNSSRRHEPLSRSDCDRASPEGSRPHLETFCLIRNLL